MDSVVCREIYNVDMGGIGASHDAHQSGSMSRSSSLCWCIPPAKQVEVSATLPHLVESRTPRAQGRAVSLKVIIYTPASSPRSHASRKPFIVPTASLRALKMYKIQVTANLGATDERQL
jgi:hypothetical protein